MAVNPLRWQAEGPPPLSPVYGLRVIVYRRVPPTQWSCPHRRARRRRHASASWLTVASIW